MIANGFAQDAKETKHSLAAVEFALCCAFNPVP
jgi:hypothetical protein